MADFKSYFRLEPYPYERDFEEGFSAEIHDPLWFLGRQWQMGEHQGENASSPVWINYELNSRPIQAYDPRFNPVVTPAEAIVESELDDWWTMGRRIRIGQLLSTHTAVQGAGELLFQNPPPPYERFAGKVDGLAVWLSRGTLGIPDAVFGAGVPVDSIPAWNSAELHYEQTKENAFATSREKLTVKGHRGGRLDWYSVDASPGDASGEIQSKNQEAIPTALQYSGAPNSRWWQMEDAAVDVGSYVPDSAHSPTAMLTELLFSHSDDWFLFPVTATAGNVVSISNVEVLDAFGRVYKSKEINAAGVPLWPGLQPPKEWTLFRVEGLAPQDLVMWHVAELPLESTPVERVQFGLDEQSNLLWAVERSIDGREVESRKADLPEEIGQKFNPGHPKGDSRQTSEREFAYVPAQGIVPYWHPYEIEEVDGTRYFVQRRLPDLSRQKPVLMPLPQAKVLQSDAGPGHHHINPAAIPSNGIEVDRRWQLARDMNGFPIIWLQRKCAPLLSPPSKRLRFDVMEEAAFE